MARKQIISLTIISMLLFAPSQPVFAQDVDIPSSLDGNSFSGTYDPLTQSPSCPAILSQDMVYPSGQVAYLCEAAVHLCLIINMIKQMLNASKTNPALMPKGQSTAQLNKDLAFAKNLAGFYLRGCQLAINYNNQGYTDQGRNPQPDP